MALSYKLVLRKNMQKGAPAGSQLYYAQSRTKGVSDMRELCELIGARSTVSSADVKAVLDSLVFVMKRELADAKIVRLPDFGSFRITFGSKGTETEEKFTTSCINRPKYTFTPGIELKEKAQTLKYEKYKPEVKKSEDDDNEEPNPFPQ